MKKFILLTTFLLSSCASFYGLSETEYAKRQEEFKTIEKHTNCLSFWGYTELLNKEYNVTTYKNINAYRYDTEYKDIATTYEDILSVAKENPSCGFGVSGVGTFSNILDRTFQKREDNKLKNAQKQAKEEKQKEKKEEEGRYAKYLKELEQKHGKKFCSGRHLVQYAAYGARLPMDCIVRADTTYALRVIQQLEDGTLYETSRPLPYGNVYFVEKNSIDSNRDIGDFLHEGVFIGVGTYSYTNLLGTKNYVAKIKRIE